ncbi:MAG TPA: LPS export ABC transporter permease LptF [Syntrophales bacterium]|nr:LPS export ABC transporter permease LptF [Syntrophales bacterium]HOS77146.1 LPS export ABC transporter permease LptF [Syntrophales bacterium]
MKTLIPRYILREIAAPFVLILFILTFVLLMGKILQIMDMMVNKGIRVFDIAQLVFFLMPSLLAFTLPISLLISILVGLGRLSSDSEILIFKASGLSLYSYLVPVGLLSLIVCILTLITTVFLVPFGNASTKHLLFAIAQQKASIGIQEKVFNDDFSGLLLYADRIPVHGNTMEGVIVYDHRMTGEPSTIVAQRAYLVSDPDTRAVTLRLEDGSTHMVDLRQKSYRLMSFRSYDVNLNISAALQSDRDKKAEKEMTLGELRHQVSGLDMKSKAARELIIELHQRLTIPVSCLVFGILAIPLGIRAQRTVKSRGFTTGLTVVVLYYLLQLGGEALVETGYLAPVVGIWSPNVLFGSAALYLFIRTAREEPLLPRQWTDRLSSSINRNRKRSCTP